jgi:hypothetical protein
LKPLLLQLLLPFLLWLTLHRALLLLQLALLTLLKALLLLQQARWTLLKVLLAPLATLLRKLLTLSRSNHSLILKRTTFGWFFYACYF